MSFFYSVKSFLSHINKYALVVGVFVFLLFFGGDSTILKHYAYNKKINELEREIEKVQKQKEENAEKLKALHSDNESLERFAREQFFMTRPGEELFIIKP